MAAKIYPKLGYIDDIPTSEKQVYKFLEALSESFYVFYSVKWLKNNRTWNTTWKENDFLILNKNYGALVLEVKGGEIHYQDGVFHQINTSTGAVNILDPNRHNDPLNQAIDGVYHYRKLFESVIRNLGSRFPVDAAVWFPTCQAKRKIEDFPLMYREASGAILDSDSFNDGPNALYSIFDFYNSKEKVNITDEEFSIILNSIAKDFNLIASPVLKKQKLEKGFIKLTNEQTGLLDYISEQNFATIQGVAGTGKTVIAREAARRFADSGDRVLFLCFNKYLCQHLKKCHPYENVDYYNIHSLLAKYNQSEVANSPEERSAALMQLDPDLFDYNSVVVDEAQDLTNDEVLYFKTLTELNDGRFLAFFDKNQMLTTSKVPEWLEKSECKLLLTRNCRNTYEIAKTSYNVISTSINQKIKMVHGDKTTISFVKGDILMKLAKLIQFYTSEENQYSYEDITILSLKSESQSILCDVNKINGITISRNRGDGNVFFTTSKKFKGLESEVVIIIDIDDKCFSDESANRNFYCACSRATHRLSLIVQGDDKRLSDIANAIEIDSAFAPKGLIAMKTQSSLKEL